MYGMASSFPFFLGHLDVSTIAFTSWCTCFPWKVLYRLSFGASFYRSVDPLSLHKPIGPMLQYYTYGTPEHPTLCFLHGFMGRSSDWSKIVETLSEDYFCVTVDLPGHGNSLSCPAHSYSMEGTAKALVEVFDDLEIERCTLIGYSMGGRVALYVSLTHSSRIARLVLESTSPGLKTEEEREGRRQVDNERARRIEQDLHSFLQDWYRQPLFASLSKHDLVEEMVATRRTNDSSELARALRGLSPGEQPSLWEHLEKVDLSTLVLTGALDSKYKAITKETAACIGSARRVLVSRAGHNVHAERPHRYLEVLVRFLEQTSTDGAPRS